MTIWKIASYEWREIREETCIKPAHISSSSSHPFAWEGEDGKDIKDKNMGNIENACFKLKFIVKFFILIVILK